MLTLMPNLTTLWVNQPGDHYGVTLSTCAVVAALAPRWVELAVGFPLNERLNTMLVEKLPNLRALACDQIHGEEVWAVLTRHHITAFQIRHEDYCAEPVTMDSPLLALPWHCMRELRNVQLPFELVVQFAIGLPNLQLLAAELTGVWGPTPAVFKQLERVKLLAWDEDVEGARFGQLCPAAVEVDFQLRHTTNGFWPALNFSGLTAMTHLILSVYGTDPPPDFWTNIYQLPRLQVLQVDAHDETVLEALSGLSRVTTLRKLGVAVRIFPD